MRLMVISSLAGLVLATACASQKTGAAAGQAVQQTRSGMTDAALTPLEDLNLKRDAIPAILQEIENPYDVPGKISCNQIEAQIIALNQVLGPDWDVASDDGDDPTLSERAADETSEEVLDIIADEATAIIPYRSWVRRLSGAKSYQKKIKQAYDRGRHRRTYLKALGLMKDCEALAVPQIETAFAPPQVDFKATTPPQYRQDTKAPEESSRFSLSQSTSSPPISD